MAIKRIKELKALTKEEQSKKLKELRTELLKAAKPGHGAQIKTKEIKRTIARILTIQKQYGDMS